MPAIPRIPPTDITSTNSQRHHPQRPAASLRRPQPDADHRREMIQPGGGMLQPGQQSASRACANVCERQSRQQEYQQR